MAPSASKQKRLAEKAAKASAKGSSVSTPAPSSTGGSTPMTSLSANGSQENLADAQEQMRKLNLATDRSAVSCRATVRRDMELEGGRVFGRIARRIFLGRRAEEGGGSGESEGEGYWANGRGGRASRGPEWAAEQRQGRNEN
jgi:ATP-binding cassette subfamily F protein 2